MVQHKCWEQRVSYESLLEAEVDLQKTELKKKEEGTRGHSSAGNWHQKKIILEKIYVDPKPQKKSTLT